MGLVTLSAFACKGFIGHRWERVNWAGVLWSPRDGTIMLDGIHYACSRCWTRRNIPQPRLHDASSPGHREGA